LAKDVSKVVVGSNFFPKKEMTDDENNGNIENKYISTNNITKYGSGDG
jgi:hypothetical protein